MKREPIRLAEPNLSGNEARYLQECITTTYVSSVGPFVDRFETQIAGATGAAGAVATSAGTTALHMALVALGVRPGDLVILPDFTFIASANAIAHCGAEPWLLDIAATTWTLDADLLRRALETETRRQDAATIHLGTGRRVAAILPVYTLGVPADMDAIVDVAREFGLPVVADAAAALGATYKGRPVGQLGANLSGISFNGNKTITSGGGGAVIGHDLELLRLVRHITTTARTGEDYTHDRIGYNHRLTNLQAAVGCAQMERWEDLVAAKRRIRRRYDDELGGLPGVHFFPSPSYCTSACWLSGIRLVPPAPPVAAVRDHLREFGIEARAFWKPMHLQAPFRMVPRSDMAVSQAIASSILTLPCSTGLSEPDQGRVIDAVRQIILGKVT